MSDFFLRGCLFLGTLIALPSTALAGSLLIEFLGNPRVSTAINPLDQIPTCEFFFIPLRLGYESLTLEQRLTVLRRMGSIGRRLPKEDLDFIGGLNANSRLYHKERGAAEWLLRFPPEPGDLNSLLYEIGYESHSPLAEKRAAIQALLQRDQPLTSAQRNGLETLLEFETDLTLQSMVQRVLRGEKALPPRKLPMMARRRSAAGRTGFTSRPR